MSRDVNSSRVGTREEGLHRVLTSTDDHPWAFIGETSLLVYPARGRCDLVVLRGPSGELPRGLALAMPIGSRYRVPLTVALLEMIETGEIAALKLKWFHEPFTGIDCDQSQNDGDKRHLIPASPVSGLMGELWD